MFNNLIESSSHRVEFRRRGSFFLFTTAGYAIFFMIAGIVSIHAYDAQMEDQNLDVSILTFPSNLPEPVTQPESDRQGGATSGSSSVAVRPTRPVLVDSTDNPTNVPDDIGIVASPFPSAPRDAVVGPRVADPPGSGQSGSGRNSGDGDAETFVRDLDQPPPAITPTPVPKIIRSSTVLNGKALQLPKPPYPTMAKMMRVQGVVSVQVLIDESGKVISSKAVSGPAALVREAEKAALQAIFSPTLIGDQPVKVSGTITYNFILQH